LKWWSEKNPFWSKQPRGKHTKSLLFIPFYGLFEKFVSLFSLFHIFFFILRHSNSIQNFNLRDLHPLNFAFIFAWVKILPNDLSFTHIYFLTLLNQKNLKNFISNSDKINGCRSYHQGNHKGAIEICLSFFIFNGFNERNWNFFFFQYREYFLLQCSLQIHKNWAHSTKKSSRGSLRPFEEDEKIYFFSISFWNTKIVFFINQKREWE
jgi:hypothetical protein